MKPTKLNTAEHAFVTYSHTPEVGVSVDEIQRPDYWSHVAQSLRVGDRIDVLAGDGAWHCVLIVRAAGRIEAVVGLLSYVNLGEPEDVSGEDDPYFVKWRGPSKKFGIIRKSDSEVLKDEFPVREAAVKYLKGHMQALAR